MADMRALTLHLHVAALHSIDFIDDESWSLLKGLIHSQLNIGQFITDLE
jgi:hypothetical protein